MVRILATAGIFVGLYALGKALWGQSSSYWGSIFVQKLTGYNMNSGKFNLKDASAGIPIMAGVGGSYLASKTGVNRYTPKGLNL